MHLYIIRFFIPLGLFFSSLASAVMPASYLANSRVFTYAEANYPGIFTGKAAEEGHYQQYLYRYYPASGNYLGIDPTGDIFILGPYTDNVITAIGNMADYDSAITEWEAAEAAKSASTSFWETLAYRMFAYAEANFPSIFTGNDGLLLRANPQFHYRSYPISDNSLGVDRQGDIFIWGPYTGGVQTSVGNVDDYRSAILAWERQPSLRLDYPGFTVWLDCAKRGATKFQYVAQRDTGNAPRYDSFFLDPNVPADCQQTSANAYGMSYDRGHLLCNL